MKNCYKFEFIYYLYVFIKIIIKKLNQLIN